MRSLSLILATASLLSATAAHGQNYTLRDATADKDAGKVTVNLDITGSRTTKSLVTVYTGIPTDAAIPTVDYVPLAQQFEVLPTDTHKTFDVLFTPDLTPQAPEASKTLTVKAVVNRGGALLDGTGTVTITDNDVPPPPAPNINVDARSCAENAGTCQVKLWRSGDLSQRSDFTYRTTTLGTATDGVDFTGVSGSGSIAAGQQAYSFTFPISDDTQDEPNETVDVAFEPVFNVKFGQVDDMTIVDDDEAPPPMVDCPDGSQVPAGQECPVVPPPNTGWLPSPGLGGLTPIPSGFDETVESWTSTVGSIPPSAAPDVVGAFRFICGPGQISNDDSILYPGMPGKSHLHQYYGNVTANANSTYDSLRASGDSTCNWTGTGKAANRSAYWMPAMMDGKGNVVRPDYVSIYYKQRPPTDPKVSNPAAFGYQGKAVQLPNGIRFIFGYDPTGKNSIRTGGMWFNCKNVKYSTLAAALAVCGPGDQVGAIINAPECWDGKNLDAPDHRSHVAYGYYHPSTGQFTCPLATHPYVIPTFTLGAWYTIAAGDDDSLWEFASDPMEPTQPAGHTFHADFFMAWGAPSHDAWWQNCISKLLNCSGGQLGNGRDLKGAATHNLKRDYLYSTRLVPMQPGWTQMGH